MIDTDSRVYCDHCVQSARNESRTHQLVAFVRLITATVLHSIVGVVGGGGGGQGEEEGGRLLVITS